MAVRELDVKPVERPQLRLVPTEPRGRPLWATLFVVLLASLLSVPIIEAMSRHETFPAFRPRPLAATSIPALDPLRPVDRPRGSVPFAGIAFVRCTRLWTAAPDGSHAHPVMQATGVTYPTFSPDGRTIAYVTSGSPQTLWVVGSDGTDPTRLGDITLDGYAISVCPVIRSTQRDSQWRRDQPELQPRVR